MIVWYLLAEEMMARSKHRKGSPKAKRVTSRRSESRGTNAKAVSISVSERGQDTVEVSTEKLTPPDRMYSAEFAFFDEPEKGDFRLVFVQVEPFGGAPRTALIIRMSADRFRELPKHEGFMATLNRTFGGDSEEDRARDKETVEKFRKAPPDKSHTERATFARMSLFGTDAEMDFYFISPNRFQDAKNKRSHDRLVAPVVSIQISGRLLSILLHRIVEWPME
ncbi:hypothetical protein ACFL51_01335 [Myxococcota bacterium]